MDDQLKRDIAGALKATIDAHGPIDRGRVPSATKRVARQIRETFKRERDAHMRQLDEKWMAARGWVRDEAGR